jgi:hypothetical protein
MPNAPLDQFMNALIWIILCGIGLLLLRELLHWIERRNQKRTDQDQKHVTMNVTSDIAPRCPSCNGAMIRRRARRGSQMGKEFWGCFAYPRCRGTRAI